MAHLMSGRSTSEYLMLVHHRRLTCKALWSWDEAGVLPLLLRLEVWLNEQMVELAYDVLTGNYLGAIAALWAAVMECLGYITKDDKEIIMLW